MKPLFDRVIGVLGSRTFFYGVLVFFALESLWIACSAAYPMAFDEDFHLGIIKIYAQHWLPFLSSQPSGADAYGAVARDPSYLYHYLMSFPYRLIAAITANTTAQIIALRVLNVAMLTTALPLFRRVLQAVRISPALTNVSLLIFALIPITPQLTGQINYDNLFIPLVAVTCLLMFRFMERLRLRQIDLGALLAGLSVCLLTSLVKYAFLPMLGGIVVWTLVAIGWQFRSHFRALWPAIAAGWRALRRPAQIGLVTLAIVSAGLFTQRLGVNMLAHKTPVPSCDKVLSTDECSAYGPWYRNYLLEQDKDDDAFSHNRLTYTGVWLYWLWYRLFFAINGPGRGFTNYPPLTFPSHTAVVLTLAGLAAVLFYARVLWRNQRLLFLLFISLCYLVALWSENFSEYQDTGQPVAVNGRYLLPVLLPLAAVMGYAFSLALARWPRTKVLMTGLVLLLFLQGGGVMTFILRSDASWDWSNSTVVHANNAARRVLSPMVIEGSKYYDADGRWY